MLMALLNKITLLFEDEEGLNLKKMPKAEKALGKWTKTNFGADCDLGAITVEQLQEKLKVYKMELTEEQRQKIADVAVGETIRIPAGRWGDYQVEGVEQLETTPEEVPATIVESSEEQVFTSQEITTDVAPTETPEVVAPVQKPPRVSKRPYINDVAELLEAGTHSAKEIAKFVLEKYPEVKPGGIQTFCVDLKNSKYNHFKPRAVVINASGKLQFEDKVVNQTVEAEPVPEAPVEVVPEVGVATEEAQPDAQAE
jgi:hypothetical protein